MKKTNPEVVIYWNKEIQRQKESGYRAVKYCKENGLNYKSFMNYDYRINWNEKKNLDFYNEYKKYYELYEKFEGTITQFCLSYKINEGTFKEYKIHKKYNEILSNKKLYIEPEGLSFVEVKPPKVIKRQSINIKSKEPEEVVEKKNDIEIIIAKGIKVIISPAVDYSAIIKIIEILKDL